MQAWAEAVNEDATFLIFNSGTYEVIGIRDRATQTLYVTNVIKTTSSECNYGKLQTGLFIAAIRDAKERSQKLRSSNPRPESWTVNYSGKTQEPKDFDLGRALVSPPKLPLTNLQKSIMTDVLDCDWLTISQARRCSRFPFEQNAFWIRTPPFTPLTEWKKRNELRPLIRIRVTEQLHHGIHRGELEFEGVLFNGIPGEWAKTVVIKSADATKDIYKLAHESRVNLELRDAGVTDIPKIIGIFQYIKVDERANDSKFHRYFVLVMEDVGQPLGDRIASESQMYVLIPHCQSTVF
jgi:hypothetical protein